MAWSMEWSHWFKPKTHVLLLVLSEDGVSLIKTTWTEERMMVHQENMGYDYQMEGEWIIGSKSVNNQYK